MLDLPPPETIRVAARTGYRTVGLRLIAVTDTTPGYPLMDDPAALRATKAAMADTGVGVLDIEFVKITPEIDVAGPGAVPRGRRRARRPTCHHRTLRPRPRPARRPPRRHLRIWRPLRAERRARVLPLDRRAGSGGSGCELVEATGRAEIGILVDTLHFDRSGSRLEQLDRITAARLPFMHVCDAPVQDAYTTEDLLHAGRAERLPPGEGGIDILAILRHMPPGIPIALEVPMTSLAREIGPEAVARRVREAADRLLAETT